jgi:hypothetical protein
MILFPEKGTGIDLSLRHGAEYGIIFGYGGQ